MAINGQTVTWGGVVTLTDTNEVVSLGSDGLVVQYSGGDVSTFAIPSATAAVTAAGYTIKATPGASNVVVGTQTVSLGGEPVTMANNDVVSLGSSGVVIQMPGGAVSTVSLPKGIASSTETAAEVVTTSTGRVASAIASSECEHSSIGIMSTNLDKVIGATSSTTNLGGNAKVAGTSTLSSASVSATPTGTILSSGGSMSKLSGLLSLCGLALVVVFN